MEFVLIIFWKDFLLENFPSLTLSYDARVELSKKKIKQTIFQTVSRFEDCSSCKMGKDIEQNV